MNGDAISVSFASPDGLTMSELITSFVTVFFAELGDKTQLLTFFLVVRYRHLIPILLGILIATLASQSIMSMAGVYFAGFLNPKILEWAISLSLIAGGILCLLPDHDKPEVEETYSQEKFVKIVLLSGLTFFLYELGDKTQLLTAVLAAKYNSIFTISAGSTIAMMAVNTPSAIIGIKCMHKIPIKTIKPIASILFIAMGLLNLLL